MKTRGVKTNTMVGRAALVAVLLAAIAVVVLGRDRLDPSAIEQGIRRYGDLAPIVFVLVYALGTILFLPGAVLTIAGGAIFGPIAGTLWNLIGATLGATVAFLIARYLAADWVGKVAGEGLGRLIRGVEAEDWRFVAFVRLVPVFPFNLVNYAFGLTRIGLIGYVLASFICMAPGAFAYTYLGYAGRRAASGQASAIRAVLFAIALIAAAAFLPRLIRRLRRPSPVEAAAPDGLANKPR